MSATGLPREADVVAVVAKESGGEIALQPPSPVAQPEIQRVTAGHPRRLVADIPHRLVAGTVGVDRATGARESLNADARTFSLGIREAGERAGGLKEIDICLRAADPLLVRPGLDMADAQLVDDVAAEGPGVGHLPVGRVLLEDAIADVEQIRVGPVVVQRLGIASEHAPHLGEILIDANRELVRFLGQRTDRLIVALSGADYWAPGTTRFSTRAAPAARSATGGSCCWRRLAP